MALQVREDVVRQFCSICYTNGYQINKEIGSGSYGKVYSAVTIYDILDKRDPSSKRVIAPRGTKCAIKLAIIRQGCEKVIIIIQLHYFH